MSTARFLSVEAFSELEIGGGQTDTEQNEDVVWGQLHSVRERVIPDEMSPHCFNCVCSWEP